MRGDRNTDPPAELDAARGSPESGRAGDERGPSAEPLTPRVEDLAQLSARLSNLLAATQIPTIFLDRNLQIVRFTPQVEDLLNIRSSDRGRPLEDFTHRLGDASLPEDARRVLERLTPVEREIQTEDQRCLLTRVMPYRTADDRIDGVVITMMDITDRKASEDALRDAKLFAESIVETLHEPLLVLTESLVVKAANSAFYNTFGANPDHVVGRKLFELAGGSWNIRRLRDALRAMLATGRVFNELEVEPEFDAIGRRVMLLNGRRIEGAPLVLLGIRDITDRTRVQRELVEARDELEARVAERTAELQRKSERLRMLSRELATAERRERKRLAAILHDELQQYLVAIKMQLSVTRGEKDRDRIASRIDACEELLGHAMASSRNLTYRLRPPVLDEDGLQPALQWLAQATSQWYGLEVEIDTEESPVSLGHETQAALFDSVRELLFNIVKHAETDRAAIVVRATPNCVQVCVSDEGAGFDAKALDLDQRDSHSTYGLLSVRERIETVGGSMSVDSAPGAGAAITLQLPLEKSAQA